MSPARRRMSPKEHRTGVHHRILVLVALAASAALVWACGDSQGELEVTNIEPRAGATAGNQPVKVHGNNFRQDISYTVYFGTKRAERTRIMDDHTLILASPQVEEPGSVDVIVAADNGPAYRIRNGFRYEDQGGNVMEQVGEGGAGGGTPERF